jgi:O-methyltransferase
MASAAKNPAFKPALRTRVRRMSYRYDFPRMIRYLLAGCASLVVFALIGMFPHSIPARTAPALLLAVVMASAWFGGFGPGVLSAFVAVAGSEFVVSESAIPAQARTADIALIILLGGIAFGLATIRASRRQGGNNVVPLIGTRSRSWGTGAQPLEARILDSFTDVAICAVDRRWQCVYANTQAGRLLQRGPDDLLHKTILEILPDTESAGWFSQLARAAAGQSPDRFEAYVTPLNAWFEFHCYPGKDGLLFRFKNISERKREDALRPLPLWNDDLEFNEILKTIEYTLVDRARCYMLFQFAKQCAKLQGDVAEVGVYKGGTARLTALTLASRAPKALHLFDTFEGMPLTDTTVDHHRKGDFADTSLDSVRRQLKGCGDVRFYKGFFPDTAGPIENSRFCLVHVDADIYQSVKDCCTFFYPRLESGGVMVFDDYGFPSCPGARKAVDEFFADKPDFPVYLPSGQCVVVRT